MRPGTTKTLKKEKKGKEPLPQTMPDKPRPFLSSQIGNVVPNEERTPANGWCTFR